MRVDMVTILMYCYKALMIREPFLCKLLRELESLLRRNVFIFVEADDIVAVHAPGVLAPELLLFKERVVHVIPVDDFRSVWTGDVHVPVFGLCLLQDVFDAVPHCSVTLC